MIAEMSKYFNAANDLIIDFSICLPSKTLPLFAALRFIEHDLLNTMTCFSCVAHPGLFVFNNGGQGSYYVRVKISPPDGCSGMCLCVCMPNTDASNAAFWKMPVALYVLCKQARDMKRPTRARTKLFNTITALAEIFGVDLAGKDVIKARCN